MSMGIDREDAVDYLADSMGTDVLYTAVAEKCEAVRLGRPKEDRSWRKNIDKDYNSRGKRR